MCLAKQGKTKKKEQEKEEVSFQVTTLTELALKELEVGRPNQKRPAEAQELEKHPLVENSTFPKIN
jgi:hypothetical protein